MMRVLSCDSCGMVVDFDKIKIIDGPKNQEYMDKFKCPLCKTLNSAYSPKELVEVEYDSSGD